MSGLAHAHSNQLQPDGQEGAADSAAAGPHLQAGTDVSAAGNAANAAQRPSESEGGASVGGGLIPQPVVGEFVPPAAGDVAGFQGETSGLHTDGATVSYGFGETAAVGSPMADMQPGTASAHVGGAPTAAAASYHPKRKMSEMGEVGGDHLSPLAAAAAAAAAAAGGEEVQECSMQQHSGPGIAQGGTQLGQSAESEGQGWAGGLNRVPSDVAMVTGDAPFDLPATNSGGGLDFLAESAGMLPDDCDSNMARAIQASLEDARMQQMRQQEQQREQQQQQQQQAGGSGGGGGGTAAPGEAVQDSTAVVDPTRPSDADIIAFENQIREAEVKRVPLMGDREPLEALAVEYESGSAIYRQKIDKLKEQYCSIRRTRGDGNCFFRSFLFGYLEHLLLSGDVAERDRVLERLQGLKKVLVEVGGYDEIVLETPLDMVLQMLRGVASPLDPLTIEGLEGTVRDEDMGAYAVWLLRMVTSAEIKRRADFFAPFVMGLADLDVPSFCSKCVDPMGEEADHVHLVALTDALQVPVRVVYLDRSLAPGGGDGADAAGGGGGQGVHVDTHDFVPEGLPPPAQPRVHLLYRPGHYDLMYLTHPS